MINEKDKGEIAQEYRLAKDKEEQIQILAQLYAVPAGEIRGILYDRQLFPIGAKEIIKGAEKIIEGLTFGGLRNYFKAFAGLDTKQAKKIFKDFSHCQWGFDTDNVGEALAKCENALKAATERSLRKGPRRKTEQTPELVPAPAAAAQPFTDMQAGIMIAALISLVTEKEFLRDQMNKDIEDLHKRAQALLDEGDAKLQEVNKLEAEIATGRQLLEQLREQKKEEA